MDIIRTARATGAWYLGLGITGMLGFLVLRQRLFNEADPGATLAVLVDQPVLAHAAVALELAVVVTQAVAAAFFFRLLHPHSPGAAFGVAGFGVANALIISVSATAVAVAVGVADGSVALPGLDAAGAVALAQALSSAAWAVGAVFFGLWLIPMGWVAVQHGLFPRVLGWVLVVGGVGYVLSAAVGLCLAGAPAALSDVLTFPATVGELWMVGYLLVRGVRAGRDSEVGPAPAAALA